MAEPRGDFQKAFCVAVLCYKIREWSPARPEHPQLPLQEKYYGLRDICTFVKHVHRQMPDRISLILLEAVQGDPALTEKLSGTDSYAVGSECLAAVMDEHERKYRLGKRGHEAIPGA